ncbi:hypothetical protein GCM10008171_26210 [Methylopila jiangsuensis]|uniref:Uncharacterized protein n=1 Tax=Methylopila jiangsuensis TaxID=586230 RepID=A0A9W6N4M9_9HYPH|nr:hypothetical protein [Methylopila jiangsuensis]MDR6285243.1 hypothetical protein [Methylopila jiangsuensis]GLK77367.1 hypothetical protein GCM10008171_26210 [Methylopila jiangsuensis]
MPAPATRLIAFARAGSLSRGARLLALAPVALALLFATCDSALVALAADLAAAYAR